MPKTPVNVRLRPLLALFFCLSFASCAPKFHETARADGKNMALSIGPSLKKIQHKLKNAVGLGYSNPFEKPYVDFEETYEDILYKVYTFL